MKFVSGKGTGTKWLAFLVVTLFSLAALAAGNSREVRDSDITEAIEDEFLFDHGVPLNDIQVETSMGVVTLKGTVSNLLARERAVKIAESVRGVRSVVDQIEVSPYWGRSDWSIERDAEQALLHNEATDSWEVEVDVENNRAILTGTVDTLFERNKAIEEAWEGGAIWVDDDLKIK